MRFTNYTHYHRYKVNFFNTFVIRKGVTLLKFKELLCFCSLNFFNPWIKKWLIINRWHAIIFIII